MGISSTGDVKVLHEIGVIWRDGKADNVLVDMIDDAWLIAWMISWRVKYIF
jgi:serine/threonine protein kinase